MTDATPTGRNLPGPTPATNSAAAAAGEVTIADARSDAARTDYARQLGTRLRAIRTQQGLSLHGVEEKSRGRWKAVVIGSYERGDRAVTVQKLAELAGFYGVPVSELLPDTEATPVLEPSARLVIDLERLQSVPADQSAPLARYARTIQSQRGDYNGRVLSIRHEDLRSLSVIYDSTPTQLTERLVEWGVLGPGAAREFA